jgi:Rrf2 family protein
MSANSRFAVAVHALVALAYLDDLVTSEQLASGTVNTNPVVLRRIMAKLAKAGIVDAHPGKTGGFRLARDPRSIDLGTVWSAIEEGSVFGLHANAPVSSCVVSCAIKPVLSNVFDDVESAMLKRLSGTTLADLVGRVKTSQRTRSRRV